MAIRSRIYADDIASAITKLAAALVTAGWLDDGAPTTTVLRSAVDSEGRAAYIKLRASSGGAGIACEMGNSRSGDVVSDPDGGASFVRSAKFFSDRYFDLLANDQMFFLSFAGDKTSYGWLCAGLLVSPATALQHRHPVFIGGSRNDADAAQTQNFMRDAANPYWSWDETLLAWDQVGAIMILPRNASGAVGSTARVDWGIIGVPGVMCSVPCHRFWLSNESEGIFIGYIKEAYLVYGIAYVTTDVGWTRCKIGGNTYVMPGFETEAAIGSIGAPQLMVKED